MTVRSPPLYSLRTKLLSLLSLDNSNYQPQGAQYWYGHAAGTTWHIHHPYLGNEDATSDDLLGYAMDGTLEVMAIVTVVLKLIMTLV